VTSATHVAPPMNIQGQHSSLHVLTPFSTRITSQVLRELRVLQVVHCLWVVVRDREILIVSEELCATAHGCTSIVIRGRPVVVAGRLLGLAAEEGAPGVAWHAAAPLPATAAAATALLLQACSLLHDFQGCTGVVSALLEGQWALAEFGESVFLCLWIRKECNQSSGYVD